MNIAVSGLSVQVSGRTILHATSLDMAPRAKIGLVGASGSGKSTLGHALVDDLRNQGRLVAHVPQSPDEALDPLRSMAYHWAEAEAARGLPPNPTHRQKLLAAFNIDTADLTDRPWAWSRGMQQRFVIAMALLGNPELIVLDEPTSALDPVIAAEALRQLDGFLKTHATAMLLITHDLALAAKWVNELMVMADGRIIERATTTELLNHPKSPEARALAAHRNWPALPC